MSKDISVNVAIRTPAIIGNKLKYTDNVCFSFIIIRDSTTVNSGIVAFTTNEKKCN
jgi:hypothetical protein